VRLWRYRWWLVTACLALLVVILLCWRPSEKKYVHKKFRLRSDEIKPLAMGQGSCFASDMITVDGKKVGYMYREPPDNEFDSGWRFLAGSEPNAYMDDAKNFGIYDVNTIANYDPQIIEFLSAPIGSAFARRLPANVFMPVHFQPSD